MEKFPKFIIEGDTIILGKVTYHKDLASGKQPVKGGGWFRVNHETNTFTFYGESYDFGPARLENIKNAISKERVFEYSVNGRNIFSRHGYSYNTGSEIIELSKVEVSNPLKTE